MKPKKLRGEEKRFFRYKRNFLIKKLGFPKKEAVAGALVAVQAFR